jgi:dUTP pyrophosphatase
MFKVKLLNDNAYPPKRANEYAAGYDLYASENCIIDPHKHSIIKTGISIQLPPNTYGRIAPRSGFTVKKHSHIGAGVIDCDYRGEIGIVVFNLDSEEKIVIEKGNKIAQLIITPILTPDVTIIDILDESDRGSGGFGSTGY